MAVRFGRFVFDDLTRALLRDDAVGPLAPKPFQLLELLLERRPRAVSKAEIHERLWPGTFVSDSSLTRLAAELRNALGDPARRPSLIRTVYGFGYAFAGPALAQPESAPDPLTPRMFPCRLVVAGRDIPLAEGENLIGRAAAGAVSIRAAEISRRHARIVVSNGHAILEDLASRNGTYLRGRRIRESMDLDDGDEIRIGKVTMIFWGPTGAVSTEAETTD